MPIYEYLCVDCREEFELLVRGNSESNLCPECGCDRLTRRFSVFGVKSGGRFEASTGSSCSGCAGHNCHGCSH